MVADYADGMGDFLPDSVYKISLQFNRELRMQPYRNFSFALFAIAFLLAIPGIAGADEIPRYHLQVGQQFQFHCDRTETRTGANASNSVRHTDWKVDVVGQNPDGSWHIVDLVDASGTVHEMNLTVPYERLVEAGDCDLYPDGSIRGDDDPLINISRLFPLLPADAKAALAGWEDQSADHSRMIHFQLAASAHPTQIYSLPSGVLPVCSSRARCKPTDSTAVLAWSIRFNFP
ncbi:MAG: hypothetical protein ABSG31_18930 [Tepidisphaeraceae bacterium]|jgi:hypothetical protein